MSYAAFRGRDRGRSGTTNHAGLLVSRTNNPHGETANVSSLTGCGRANDSGCGEGGGSGGTVVDGGSFTIALTTDPGNLRP